MLWTIGVGAARTGGSHSVSGTIRCSRTGRSESMIGKERIVLMDLDVIADGGEWLWSFDVRLCAWHPHFGFPFRSK